MCSAYVYSQEYTFKKIGADNYSFDMNGKIIIKDNLITIVSDSHNASEYPVKKDLENDTLKKFTSSLEDLKANFILNSKQKTFVYQFKDTATDKETKMTYLLD